jgi:hypothetical protein
LWRLHHLARHAETGTEEHGRHGASALRHSFAGTL